MILDKKTLNKVRIYLAMQGTGSKKKLAEDLNLHESQISLLVSSGIIPASSVKRLTQLVK